MDNQMNHLDRVIKLLIKGTDRKRVHDKYEEAKEALQEASEITDEHDLPEPWPQLVSYRLAHVLFRRAETKQDFLKIDELLAEAARANCLGPYPRLYRLASMFQCGQETEKMAPVFNALLKEIDEYGVDDEYDDEAKEVYRSDETTALQNNFFNMLEFAAYFTRYPYDGLEGKGLINKNIQEKSLRNAAMRHGHLENEEPFSDLFCKLHEWRLIGTIPGLSTTAYPGDIALAELESRMKREEIKPPCVAFQISNDKKYHHWNFNLQKDENNKFIWKKVPSNTKHLLFIAAIFQFQRYGSRYNLLSRIFNGDKEEDAMRFRKRKNRCKKALIEGFKEALTENVTINFESILLDDKQTDRPVPRFHPSISVIGAMDVSLSYA